jgi:putative transposase
VRKSLSTRTHVCAHCGLVLDRDENVARNILALAWLLVLVRQWSAPEDDRTAGQAGTGSGWPSERVGTGSLHLSANDSERCAARSNQASPGFSQVECQVCPNT